MGKFYGLIFLLGILITQRGQAQTLDCEQTLALATEEFNAGHFYNVPSVLNECLANFNRDQRQRAHLLLTQTYLLLDDPIGAQRSYLEVLWANPEFVPDPELHAIDVVYLSKKFTATPKFSWFLGAGSNVSPVSVIHHIDLAPDGNKSYSLRPGYTAGVGGEYSYNDHIRVRLEANFMHTSYRSTISERFVRDQKTFIDRQTWINVPAYMCYSDNAGTYRPYGYIGYSVSALLTDKGSVILENVKHVQGAVAGTEGGEAETEKIEVTSPDFDLIHARNRLNHSVIFGGGIKYKLGLDFVFADLRYSAGLKNIANENLYANGDLNATSPEHIDSGTPATAFGHVDDLFRLDNLAITVGFIRPLYKPRELKRARTKGILRKLRQRK